MADPDKVTQLGRLLAAAARGHHEAHGSEPSPRWPEWYAERVQADIGDIVGFEPTKEEITAWLREADEKYRSEEAPQNRWPTYYAELILDSMAVKEG